MNVTAANPLPDTAALTSARAPLRSALPLAILFAVLCFAIHLGASLWGSHLGYGFFRDELYFLVCGHHLDWGYVDQAPLVAVQARLAEMLFGLSPTGIRILSFVAAGVTVGLTGLLTWQFGGRRTAQILAMMAALTCPVLLGSSNYLSMNSFEPCFWMGALLALLRIAEGSAGLLAWLVFGVLSGLGIENKHSTVFFLVALVLGLLISPQRKILFTRGCAIAVAVIFALALPNFIWQWVHRFPTYELLNNIAHSDKNTKLPPLAFLWQQLNMLLIFTAPLWIRGLIWLFIARSARPWRFVGFTYLLFLGMMMAMHAKDYYVAPIYPVLFAAGAAALTLRPDRPKWAQTSATAGHLVYTAILVLFLCFVIAPIVLTILPPDKYNAYTARFGANKTPSEKFTSPLPQYLSDRFGWPEMVAGFAQRYNALPPEERAHTAIVCGNYGEASAVNVLGPKYGLPIAISGHQNYFYWGWNNYTGESVLTLGNDPKDYSNYAEVIDLGTFDAPWIMDHEHHHYFLLKHRNRPYSAEWNDFKYWY